jgi:uncharacterized coiled-coil protein SlyX
MDRPSSSDELPLRLSDVESALTFLQRTVDELGSVLLDHARRMDDLQKRLASLAARFEALADSIVETPRSAADEKPPHY